MITEYYSNPRYSFDFSPTPVMNWSVLVPANTLVVVIATGLWEGSAPSISSTIGATWVEEINLPNTGETGSESVLMAWSYYNPTTTSGNITVTSPTGYVAGFLYIFEGAEDFFADITAALEADPTDYGVLWNRASANNKLLVAGCSVTFDGSASNFVLDSPDVWQYPIGGDPASAGDTSSFLAAAGVFDLPTNPYRINSTLPGAGAVDVRILVAAMEIVAAPVITLTADSISGYAGDVITVTVVTDKEPDLDFTILVNGVAEPTAMSYTSGGGLYTGTFTYTMTSDPAPVLIACTASYTGSHTVLSSDLKLYRAEGGYVVLHQNPALNLIAFPISVYVPGTADSVTLDVSDGGGSLFNDTKPIFPFTFFPSLTSAIDLVVTGSVIIGSDTFEAIPALLTVSDYTPAYAPGGWGRQPI